MSGAALVTESAPQKAAPTQTDDLDALLAQYTEGTAGNSYDPTPDLLAAERAQLSQRLQALWLNREQNPRAFQVAVKHMAREFQKTMNQRPDPEATADREAVAAAVKGASSRAPESSPVNLGRMSDHELRNHVRSSYGFDPGF